MNGMLKTVLSLSISGTLLMFVLFLLRQAVKERFSKRWQYYIWLIVVARFMLPFAPEGNLMGTFFQGIDRAIQQAEFVPSPGQQGAGADRTSTGGPDDGQNNRYSQQTVPSNSAGKPVQIVLTAIWNHLWLVWFTTALSLLIRKITAYQDFVKYVRAGCVEVADIDLLERFGKLVEKSRVRMAVELYTNSLISSPLLIGFFRPCIILPSFDLPPADFEFTMLHELTHCRRGDMFYKWLVQLTVCVHWFNPFVYRMSREIGRSCELSCDEAVIKPLDLHGRRAYGDTLVNAMETGGSYRDTLASVTLGESGERLKERLDAIMRFKKTTRLTAAVSLALVFALTFGAAAFGAYNVAPGEEGAVVINLSSEGKNNIMHSSSFEAKSGQFLTLEITSSIKGGADLFLFSPSKQEQRITIGGRSETKTIALSEGIWSYNCTGFFDSGDLSIVGTLSSSHSAETEETPSAPTIADSISTDPVVINLSSGGQNSIVHSSSFEAKSGQILTLEVNSSIDGTVDLFLFSPANQEQHITMGGNNETKTIVLSEGRWSYNCTGFFDSGDISIVGTLE